MHEDDPDPLYLPSTQPMHFVALVDEYVPASHAVQIDAPSALIDPAPHDSQLVCPVAPWYRPASHKSHEDEPVKACTVPPEHAVHPVVPVEAA